MTKPKRPALSALPGFEDDVMAQPDHKTQIMAMDQLNLIRDGKRHGIPLGDHVKTGDLTDCFKLYFGPDGSRKPQFRLVYRLRKEGLEAIGVEAVAVGRREALSVYATTAKRLGR